MKPRKLMTEKQAATWEVRRSNGAFLWIVKWAALYGILAFSSLNLFYWLFGLGTDLTVGWLFSYILTGAFCGGTTWIIAERNYRRYIESRTTPAITQADEK